MGWREWTGIGERSWEKPPNREVQPGKTLWDWLQLLIVPAILVGVTFVWTASQTRSDNKREDRRVAADRTTADEARQDATLQGYLDQMSGLMLREKLLTSFDGSAVQAVGRTVTLTALRRLDGERKVEVVRFLHEAGLLGALPAFLPGTGESEVPLVRLDGADLSGANFGDAYLAGANLAGANLTGANLVGAALSQAVLFITDLRGANLLGASLLGADLRSADLRRADLRRAELGGANLEGAILVGANLGDADPDGPGPQEAAGLVKGLDLGRYMTDLTPKQQKEFLDSQEAFLDSLSPEELSKFKLTPEKLAKLRREASGG